MACWRPEAFGATVIINLLGAQQANNMLAGILSIVVNIFEADSQ